MKRRLPNRRTLLMLLLLLVGGAILNVAVACVCCMEAKRNEWLDRRERPVNQKELAWWDSINAPVGVHKPSWVQVTETTGYAQIGHFGLVAAPHGTKTQSAMASSAFSNEAGWPMPTLRGVWFNIPVVTSHVWRQESRGAWRFQSAWLDERFPLRSDFIPLRPIWPGFAINTLFYAAILWGLFAAPFALRRRRRIKHGLCPKCAYPVGASEVCTECGSGVRLPLPSGEGRGEGRVRDGRTNDE